jgi:alkanesulfonate monooxygenase SsuD/methylene tetrahydromethanopterin reductase-like flavin-dependent oxidoreductase (luciferase family)
MQVGLFLLAAQFPGQTHTEVLRRTVDAAVTAERAGFDGVWIAEHHFMTYGVCPSATTLAAYVLGRTDHITVGTAVSVLSTQHPVAVAEQAALLDQVSDGRFRLGVGRGGPWVDLEVFGTGLARYESGFEESLDLLLAALRQDRVGGGGTFRFRPVPIVPRPLTGPPVVVACTSPATAALAARRGLPMLLGMHAGDEEKRALVEAWDAVAPGAVAGDAGGGAGASDGSGDGAGMAGGAGHGVGASGLMGHPDHMAAGVAYVAESRAEARQVLCSAMPRWLGPGLAGYAPIDGRPRRPRDPDEYAALLCEIHPVGTAADCVARLEATAERTGIEHFVLLAEGAGDPARTRENITRLGAEVLPRLR